MTRVQRSADSLIEWLDRFPPCVVRILARTNRGHRGLTTCQIATAAGLSEGHVSDISRRTTWKGMNLDTIDRFCRACGFNPTRIGQQSDFLRRRRMGYLARGHHSQLRLYRKLFRIAASITPRS